jgi:hypothetical protein
MVDVAINTKVLEIRLPSTTRFAQVNNQCLAAEVINSPLGSTIGDVPIPSAESLLLVAPLVFMGTDSGIGDNLKIA